MKIRPIVLGMYEHRERILMQQFWHEPDQCHFFRLPGGGIEYGEPADAAIRREVQEELLCEISEPTLVEIIENIYDYGDETKHEIIFLYKADLLKTELLENDEFVFCDNGIDFRAVWISRADIIGDKHLIYPLRFREMIKNGEV